MNTQKTQLELRADSELYLTQIELELGMKEAGIQRYRRDIEKKRNSGREDDTSYGARIVGSQLATLAKAIEAIVEQRKSGSGAGAGCAATPILVQLGDYKKAAFFTLKAVVAGISEVVPMARVCVKIGLYIEDEIRNRWLKEADEGQYKSLLKAIDKKGDYTKKRAVDLYIHREAKTQWKPFSDATRLKIGVMLIDCLFKSMPEFVEVRTLSDTSGGTYKSTKFLAATEETMRWINEHKEVAEALSPMYEPMVVPPVQWKAGMVIGGGYITNHVKQLKLVKVRSKGALESIRHADMEGVYNALNAAQETPWRIRKEVLEVLKHCYLNKLPMGGLMLQPEQELPPQPNKELYPEQHKEWRSVARGVYEENIKLNGAKLNIWYNMTTAERYSHFDRIYMPWQLDFRGRMYCVTRLSPQGEDYIKALLEFADGVPLSNEEGVNWLFIHVANLFGVDKVPFPDRIQWTKDNFDKLVAVCEDPLTNRFWEEADSPWQALAACYELKGYKEQGYAWESRMPVALDGSCSGLQNLGMALKCEITGKSVNLLPQDRPADIYREVANKVIVMLEDACDYHRIKAGEVDISDVAIEKCKARYFEIGVKPSEKKWLNVWSKVNAPNKERLDDITAEIRKLYLQVTESYAWLQFGVTRSTAKRSVMTFPYGSEEYGFKEQVMEDTLRPALKDLLKKYEAKSSKELPNTVWPFYEDGFQAASVMAKFLFISVKQTVLKAAEAMSWMQQSARLIAKQQRPIVWTTPLGFPVTQDYRRLASKQVKTILNGTRYDLSVAEETLEMDTSKAANSISPNVVHSLDSSHLMLTVANAADEGFRHFALIHDSFGTHAANTGRFFQIIRESFVELYDTFDVFAELKRQFDAQLPPDTVTPDLPKYGQLSRKAVIDSAYAFA